MLTTEKAHAAWVPALVAFAAATLGICFLQLTGPASAVDSLGEALWITAWALAVCAVGASVVASALLWRRGGVATRSGAVSIVLVLATIATLALIWLTFPPFGAGGGAA